MTSTGLKLVSLFQIPASLLDFAMGESQELNSQELVGAALYACDFLTGAVEPLPQLAELDEPQAADFPIPPAICLEEDPRLIASEIAMVHKIKNVREYV